MTAPLTLIQLKPDLLQLRRWLAQTQQAALAADPGYALHACAKAVLGSLAPKPFVLLQRSSEPALLLGYVAAEHPAVERAASLSLADPLAAAALGLNERQLRTLPNDWRPGERLRFSLRAVPMVRSRSQPDGGLHEVDAARHSLFATAETPREQAYQAWLARELARDGAAELLGCDLRSFSLQQGVRRHARVEGRGRQPRGAWLPDAQFNGLLAIRSPEAFQALLTRGVGRHRAFGFGCLLLAPA